MVAWWRQFPSKSLLVGAKKTGQGDCHQQGLRGHQQTMLQLVERNGNCGELGLLTMQLKMNPASAIA
jgi:hypothetical protein